MTDTNPRHALYELACRYAQAVDRRDWRQLAVLFTPDARLAGPGFAFDDRDAIVAGMVAIGRYEATQHQVHNQLVTLDGGEAAVETYGVACHVYVRDGVKRKLDWGLRYHDRCVFDGGTWRYAARTLLVDWAQDLPLEG
ncbi:nuclear transport factor 2 family protein [Burkholderia sp. Ac-20353]|uniref:nuclear transport factor 2 family protein n=1 Tax=Burkholderia sp. Ac-20353 TaxID=2703894 RepID=UPI00197B20E2|nr:nuclear transport factor 2 family protein [Burkholderia sp. Ac-20353]MBN3790502.1 nuclear transport factor 2 family protein [Burkholderia sp. Ac-20353]